MLYVTAMVVLMVGLAPLVIICYGGYRVINGEITVALGIKVFVVSVVMALMGTLLPAIYASRIDPMSLIQRGSA